MLIRCGFLKYNSIVIRVYKVLFVYIYIYCICVYNVKFKSINWYIYVCFFVYG